MFSVMLFMLLSQDISSYAKDISSYANVLVKVPLLNPLIHIIY